MNTFIRERMHWRTTGSFNIFCHHGFSHGDCTFLGNCGVMNTRSVRDLFLHTSREDKLVPKYWTCLQKKCVSLIFPKYRLVMRYLWGKQVEPGAQLSACWARARPWAQTPGTQNLKNKITGEAPANNSATGKICYYVC